MRAIRVLWPGRRIWTGGPLVEWLLADLAPVADRLRLEGELAEIRARNLKFTLAKAGQLLAAHRMSAT